MVRIVCFIVSIFLGFFSLSHAFGVVYGDNHKFTAGITQRGQRIELDGRILSGPKCGNLLIRCFVLSTHGQYADIIATANYSGSGSSLYDGKQKISIDRGRGLPEWQITQITATCND